MIKGIIVGLTGVALLCGCSSRQAADFGCDFVENSVEASSEDRFGERDNRDYVTTGIVSALLNVGARSLWANAGGCDNQ